MKKPHVNALEWFQMDRVEREKYTPRKLSDADLVEINKVGSLQVKREIQYTIQRARMQYALENTTKGRREKFIKKYRGDKLGTRNKALIVTDEARAKYAVSNAMSKWYGANRVKGRTGKGSKGGVRDLGWYIRTGKQANMDDSTLTMLDIISSNISFSELQQLYAELPDLDVYYPKELEKRTGSLVYELNINLFETIYNFMDELSKDNAKESDAIWEAIEATFNEPEMSTNPEDYQETIPGEEE